MDNSIVTVKKAMEFGTPDYIPCFHNTPQEPRSDIADIGFTWRNRAEPNPYTTEWGYLVNPAPQGGYHIDDHPILDWDQYRTYAFPDVRYALANIDKARESA